MPALVIHPTFDSSITTDPDAAKIMATINTAIQGFEHFFSDSMTVDITFKKDLTIDLAHSQTKGLNVPYTDYRTALVNHAANNPFLTLALTSLPDQTNNPANGNANVRLKAANARLLGFTVDPPADGSPESVVAVNTPECNLDRTEHDPGKYDLLSVVTHEIDEILGFGSRLDQKDNGDPIHNGDPAPTGPARPDDLYRYDQNGARSFNTVLANQAYFSIDGGTTLLARFNQTEGGDFGDWFSDGSHSFQVQDSAGTPGETDTMGVELVRLAVLGYTPAKVSLNSSGVLNFNNDTSVDLRIAPNNPQILQVFENKGKVTGDDVFFPDQVYVFNTITQINVHSSGSHAELYLDFGNGNVLPPGGLTYNGGAATDTIDVTDDTNFTLSNSALQIDGLPVVHLSGVEVANLTGGDSANAFSVSSWTGTATLHGLGGDDSYRVDLVGGNGRVVLDEAPGGGDDTATVNGANVSDTFVITPTSLTRAGEVVEFNANLEVLNANGFAVADHFDVTPSAGTAFNIDGGDPTTRPGDSLTYRGAGTLTITGPGAGIISAPGVQDVRYVSIEECVRLTGATDLVLSAAVDANNGPDNGVPDSFRVVRNGADTEVYVNGNLAACINSTLAGSITINGSTDDDVLTVDNSGGLIRQKLTFNGDVAGIGPATENNRLLMVGDPGPTVARETYTSTGTMGGTVRNSGNLFLDPDDSAGPGALGARDGDEESVDFTNVDRIDDTKPANALDIFATPGEDNDFNVTDGGNVAVGILPFRNVATTLVGNTDAANRDFAPIRFAQKLGVTINGLDGEDTLRVNNPTPASDLVSLQLFGNALPGGAIVPDDGLADTFRINTCAVSRMKAWGQGGDDTFVVNLTGAGPLSLDGGAGDDTFRFAGPGAITGAINGGGRGANGDTLVGFDPDFVINGVDSGFMAVGPIHIPFVGVANLTGGTGDDTFSFFGAGRLTGAIDGGGAGPNGDTLVGNDNGDAFTITGANAGHLADPGGDLLGAGGFTNIQNLTGGLLDDTFTFHVGGSLTGKLDGGGQARNGNTVVGDDVGHDFTIYGVNAGSISVILPGGFRNVQNLTGGGGDDAFTFTGAGSLTGAIDGGGVGPDGNSITGNNAGDRFVITAPDEGTIDGLLSAGFANVGNLRGGRGDDTFVFFTDAADLAGGRGSLSGALDGGGAGPRGDTLVGNDSGGGDAGDGFLITGVNAGFVMDPLGSLIDFGFTRIQNLTGGANDDTFTFAGGLLTGKIDGGGLSAVGNTIVGDDTPRTFTIYGVDAGSVSTLLTSGFVNVQNLTGGSGDDIFKFLPGGRLTGMLDGGGGMNTLNGSPSSANFFAITGQNSGNVNGVDFANVANLIGGNQADTFQFEGAGALDGGVSGGPAGTDTIDYHLYDSAVTTNLEEGTSTGVSSNFDNIDGLVGSLFDDELVGEDTPSTWTITGFDSGNVSWALRSNADLHVNRFTWTNVETVSGGSEADLFRINPGGGQTTVNGGPVGGADVNTLQDNTGTPNLWSVDGADTGYQDDINRWNRIQNLVGGRSADTFAFLEAGSLGGFVDGKEGVDRLDYSRFITPVTTTLNAPPLATTFSGTSTGLGAGLASNFLNLEGVIGSPFNDRLVGPAVDNRWVVGGLNTGAIDEFFSFADMENLIGNSARDVFGFRNGGRLTGSVYGQGGSNWLDYSQVSSSVRVDLSMYFASRVASAFNVENVLGSAGGGDVLNGDALNNILVGHMGNNSVFGGAGRDIVIGGQGAGLLRGGEGDDIVIAGQTSYDYLAGQSRFTTGLVGLECIMREWSRADLGLAARIANVRAGGGLTGGKKLVVSQTVTVALGTIPGPRQGLGGGFRAYTAVGGGGDDLFFVRWASQVTDLNWSRERFISS